MPSTKNKIDLKKFAAELVNGFNSDELRRLHSLFIGGAAPTRKGEMASKIASHLTPTELQAVFDKLGEFEQLAVAEALYSEDGYSPEKFEAKYGAQVAFSDPKSRVPSMIRLFLRYEIFRQFRVWPSLEACLRSFVDKPESARIKSHSELPKTFEVTFKTIELQKDDPGQWVRFGNKLEVMPTIPPKVTRKVEHVKIESFNRAERAQVELGLILRAVQEGKVAVSEKTGIPTGDTLEKISQMLKDDFYHFLDPRDQKELGLIRSYAWPMLLLNANLVQKKGKKLVLTGAPKEQKFSTTADMIKDIWQRWLDCEFDEFIRVDSIKGQKGKGKYSMSQPRRRRLAIINTLLESPSNVWIEFDEFMRYLRAEGNSFVLSYQPMRLHTGGGAYSAVGGYGSEGDKPLQLEYTLCFLLEYAATLGLIDVALVHPRLPRAEVKRYMGLAGGDYLSRYDGLLYIRINELGDFCLDKSTEFKSKPRCAPKISVRPSLRIALVEGELSVADKLILDAFAENIDDGVWDLSRGRSIAACEDGHDIETLRELLTTLDDQELPDQVDTFISQVKKRYMAVEKVGAAILFQCRDAEIAKEICEHSLMKNLCRAAGDRQLVVKAADEEKFRKALRIIGYGSMI
jgi:hypothetical protein